MSKFEKGNSVQADSELIQMRSILQDKLTEDQKVQLKNKEKSQVLFGEVVRLGESQEKMNEFLQNLSITVESRVSQLESRLNHGERQVVTLDTKADTNVNLLIELAEKVERRVQMVETALLALGNEQEQDHKIIDKVEIGSQRLQEDLKLFLRQLQGDIQHRVELKTGDLLNRLIQEQEERLRTHQDLKYTFDVKEKMTHEKMQFDREEFRDRLANLETLMRTEFQRKEEMINHLNANLDMQIRSIFEGLKQEEGARFQGEANMRDDLSQVGDAARDAIEQFKSYQASITEKMTEMVKTEIDCRLKAEKDLKQMIQNTTKGIFQELSNYKDAIEKNRIKAEYDTKEASKSFSEKADILSRYIEEETQRNVEVVKSQHQQTKEMITTITESLKQTIISNEKFKSDATKKFIKHDQSLQILKNELTKISHMGDSQIVEKMRELQASLESHLGVNTKILEDRIENLASMVDVSLGNFEKALYYNRETFSDIINKLNDEISEQHQCVCEDLEKLLGGLETLQSEIDSIADDLNEKLQNVAKQTALIESQTTVQLSTEKLMREHMINKFSEEIEDKHRDIDESLEKIEERLEEEEKVQQGNDDRNLEKFAEIGEEMGNIVNSLDSLGMELGKIEEIRAKNQEEVLNLIKDPVAKAEFENIQNEVEKLKQGTNDKERETAEFIEDIKNKVNDLQYKFDQNSQEVRDYIQEIFDRKIVGLHEKLQRDNEKLWNSVVSTGRNNEIKTKNNLSAIHDKIMKIANNSEGYKPKIRGFKQDN
ncbi:unnamed protein product [Blepharisma stoltei]|uniref:Uncharacterized protein n=1 Tax=Blepharisma stoltei TaxID=1481888 RepID=A0AAU9IUN1_9CILI|nr:unnamed protein product [Blepharisma stoltei]